VLGILLHECQRRNRLHKDLSFDLRLFLSLEEKKISFFSPEENRRKEFHATL